MPNQLTRRDFVETSITTAALAAAFGGTAAAAASNAPATQAAEPQVNPATVSKPPVYQFKTSINQWAFPYPQKMSLTQCLQLAKDAGFDAIELNYDLDNDLSPKNGTKHYQQIRAAADKIGIGISGLCSFLFWPYPLTSNDPVKRARGIELAGLIAQAAHDLGVENVLVVPGAVHIPWRDDHEPVPNDVCDQRAKAAIKQLLPAAEKLGVCLNMENIFFNGYLMTPGEMNAFVDHFASPHVMVHFDTGNIMQYQFPEHWATQLGKRIKNVHLKEFTKKGTDSSLESFRPLLDGTTNWPAVLAALDTTGYRGHLTFEYFHPWQHWPEALIFQTADSLRRMLGKEAWRGNDER